jgi:tetratricopeptide (TPR) repeat protein
LGNNSVDELFSRTPRSHSRFEEESRSRFARGRTPSSAGYLIAVIIIAAGLGLVLWWMLANGGDEAPWLPAGLAVSVVLLVALSAREVVMRRAWTRYLLDHGIQEKSKSRSGHDGRSHKKGFSASLHSAALRAIQKQSSAADAPSSTPEAHFEVAQLCHDYLAGTEEAMRSGSMGSEKGLAIRAGQERVRSLHKHHLLTWARGQSLALTREAQQRARTFDKIETANKALECLDAALRVYPDEEELRESKTAIGEFIASVKVAHWVELAERSAFKGHYRRAIDRYRDALFYLNQDVVKEDVRRSGSERIEREITRLDAALRSASADDPRNVNQGSSGES